MKTYRRPNILVLYTDEQRLDSLACNGNAFAITPNLDKLASQGANFHKYFVNNPVCAPSRICFLSGRYCSSHGHGDCGHTVEEDLVTLPRIVGRYGYETAHIGKLHFMPHARRDHRDLTPGFGYDTFILSDEPGCYDDAYIKWVEAMDPEQVPLCRTMAPAEALRYGKPNYYDKRRSTATPYLFEGKTSLTHSSFVASETCRFLETYDSQKPFYLFAGFYAPHGPLNPPKEFVDQFDMSKAPMPHKDALGRVFNKDMTNYTDDDYRKMVTYYHAIISHVDDCVGQILKTLDESGLAEDTIVIFTCDHGEYLGDHGRVGKGMPGEDCIINVPFLMRYPKKIKPGTIVEAMVESVDVLPTLLDYCAIQTPPAVQGQSFKPVLEGATDHHKDSVLVEKFLPFKQQQSTVRTDRYKYYLDAMTGEDTLWDLQKDPNELYPVTDDPSYASVLSDMRKLLCVRKHLAAYNHTPVESQY